MSVLEREDVARRVSEALKATVAADAQTPAAKIVHATEVAPPVEEPQVEDAVLEVEAPVDEVEPATQATAPVEVAPVEEEDDVWVVAPLELDGVAPEPAPAPAVQPLELDPPADARPKRSRVRVAVAAALLVVAGAGVWAAFASRSFGSDAVDASASAGGGEAPSDLPTLRGTFTVWNAGANDDPCASIPSASVPIAGDSVRLRGTEGGRLIMGTLSAGSPTKAGRGCAYPFVLRNVPPADKYIVAVAKQGSLTFSRAQLDSVHWRVSMSFGSPSPG